MVACKPNPNLSAVYHAMLCNAANHPHNLRSLVCWFVRSFVRSRQIDATMERRICTAVLKQLDDNSNDVQTIAVKCLGALLRKVQEAQVCVRGCVACSNGGGSRFPFA